MTGRFILFSVLMAVAVAPTYASLEPGQWEISSDGNRFSLDANQADLKSILGAIRELSPADFMLRAIPDHHVSVRCFNVPLDDLLNRLGLNFVLLYERQSDDDDFTLAKGWLGVPESSKPQAPSPFSAEPSLSAEKSDRPPLTDSARSLLSAGKPGDTYCAAFPITVRVDGNMIDWPEGVPRHKVDHTMFVGDNGPTDDADASFSLGGVADDDYLYLSIDVLDDQKAAEKASSLPLAIDDYIHLLVGAGDNGQEPVSVKINRHHVLTTAAGSDRLQTAARQYVSFNSGSRAAIIDSPSGWKLEVAVPFSALGIQGSTARELQFNVLLHDADKGKEATSLLAWNRSGKLAVHPAAPVGAGMGAMRVLDIR